MAAGGRNEGGTLPVPDLIWRPSTGLVALAILALLLTFVPFAAELDAMWRWWLDRPEYSHGVLMPLIAVLLVWQRRDQLERLPFPGSWWGLALLFLGALLLALGKLAAVQTITQYAFVFTLGGLVLSLVGVRAAGLLLVPFAILVLMIPPPEFIFKNLTAGLQLVSSRLGVEFMRLCGVSALLEGNVIDLGTYKLEVAEACSGLRYLFPLMVLAFIMAYLYKTSFWKRALVFASSVPLTIVMNSVRIGAIGVMVDRWGEAMAVGRLHDFEGWLMFMLSAAVLLGEIALLSRIGSDRRPWRTNFALDLPATTRAATPRARWKLQAPFLVSCGVLALLAAVVQLMPVRVEVVPVRKSFVEFPAEIGAWTGHRVALDQVYLDALKLDDYILADFSKAGSVPINLYVAWYDSQRAGQSTHSPRTCIPGGGWQIVSFGQRQIVGRAGGWAPLRVNQAVIANGAQRELVYYWFRQRGRTVTNEYLVKWYMFVDSLGRHRTDGALVRLVMPIAEGRTVEQSQAQLDLFAGAVAQRLMPFIPD